MHKNLLREKQADITSLLKQNAAKRLDPVRAKHANMRYRLAAACLIVVLQSTHGLDFGWRRGRPIDLDRSENRLTSNVLPTYGSPRNDVSSAISFPSSSSPHRPQRKVECGQENYASRIVRGSEASPHQFPWLAVVQSRHRHYTGLCTGSLIHPSWVLTAAHCVSDGQSHTVQLGVHNRTAIENNKIEIDSIEHYTHSDYDPLTYENDIALVKLPQPVPVALGPVIGLSCLPRRSDVGQTFDGRLATITGWGKTSDSTEDGSDILRYARNRQIISNAACTEVFSSKYIHQSTLCVAAMDKRAICNGDSGGPLNLQRGDGDLFVQVGINSFKSKKGCESGYPQGYVRLTEFLDWIELTTKGDAEIEE